MSVKMKREELVSILTKQILDIKRCKTDDDILDTVIEYSEHLMQAISGMDTANGDHASA